MHSIKDHSWFHLSEKRPPELFIKDPVHMEISFPPERFWLFELVNTLEMQRLGSIKQVALSIFYFPSASHTRLMHSLGVYELCGRFIDHFLLSGDLRWEEDWREINVALAYSLLHDVGHGPLSHVFESVAADFDHETMGLRIIETEGTKVNGILRNKALADGLEEEYYVRELGKVIRKTTEHRWILDLVSSDVDVDRLDFLLRDSYYSGVSYGRTTDINILVRWSVIRRDRNGDRRFCFLLRTVNHLEQFLSARKMMYQDFYWNQPAATYKALLKGMFEYLRENRGEFEGREEYRKLSYLLEPMDSWKLEDFLWLNDGRFLDLVEGLFSECTGKIAKYRDFFFGRETGMTVRDLLGEEVKEKKRSKLEEIEIDLWDPQKNSFVRRSI